MPAYPHLEITVMIGVDRWVADAFPDTGFESGLTIPRHLAASVAEQPYRRPIRTADGTVHYVDSWDGAVEIEGRVFPCEIMALGSHHLLGREVLDRLDIRFEFGWRLHVRFGDQAT
jgi:predicted aspartyl protease